MLRTAYVSVLLHVVACLVQNEKLRSQASRLVYLDQGTVRGYKVTNSNFYAFYSIPYATAPTGSLKFKCHNKIMKDFWDLTRFVRRGFGNVTNLIESRSLHVRRGSRLGSTTLSNLPKQIEDLAYTPHAGQTGWGGIYGSNFTDLFR
ncbi:hypothetical protein EVAR_69748_1 [Eumeta japonica]|uniref:Carboxylesterase type B domain-containing protein n=1 Tax=Eumeta variegata TaxID=151549 RepID=A0A4C2ABL7_EUMVA|nr:hypothetical protein EVAR_69748_1 [Eumeta japonica]